jgi:enoyl-[acyl-carrier protein] reductase I
MAGKRGLIMGVANDHSIAWGIARQLYNQGAELAFTYQGGALEKRVRPLAQQAGSSLVVPCDVEQEGDIERVFHVLGETWDSLDFVVHAIAYSDKDELKGAYLDTTRENFRRTLDISCYSFTAVAQAAAAIMSDGGSLLTLTYLGAERVTPNYNVMGVAKAALEASVRTLAGSAIADARFVFNWSREHAPLRRNVLLEEVGKAGLYLISPLSAGVTGEVHHVDGGYNLIGIPSPRNLNGD